MPDLRKQQVYEELNLKPGKIMQLFF